MALSQALESQLQLLREALTSERSAGEVRFSVTALGEETDLEALDARATQQEFRPLADSWRPLSRAEDWAWTLLTWATLDVGIGACGARLVGLVVVMDED
ncbi:hypothetical protein F0U62_06910 [Cystobacter fuscus]|uniref:hypothetical protein n=1 Tax=Cystobacter fuscus TaxID=43 RepID=UPI002B2D106F|nr:hypothetical protein F0U62_06910 [Cystobacter fuscus]